MAGARYEVAPEDMGLQRATLAQLTGGDARENAAIILAILKGERSCRRDVVLLNERLRWLPPDLPIASERPFPWRHTRSIADTRCSDCSCWLHFPIARDPHKVCREIFVT